MSTANGRRSDVFDDETARSGQTVRRERWARSVAVDRPLLQVKFYDDAGRDDGTVDDGTTDADADVGADDGAKDGDDGADGGDDGAGGGGVGAEVADATLDARARGDGAVGEGEDGDDDGKAWWWRSRRRRLRRRRWS